MNEIPEGVSKWIEYGKKFGYFDYIKQQFFEEVFNSKKGDRVNVPKKDGTEQIWQCIEIKK